MIEGQSLRWSTAWQNTSPLWRQSETWVAMHVHLLRVRFKHRTAPVVHMPEVWLPVGRRAGLSAALAVAGVLLGVPQAGVLSFL